MGLEDPPVDAVLLKAAVTTFRALLWRVPLPALLLSWPALGYFYWHVQELMALPVLDSCAIPLGHEWRRCG